MKHLKKLYVLLCWLTAARWLVHLVLSRIEELTLFWAEACGWMAESRAGQIVLSWEFLPSLEDTLINVWEFSLTPGLILILGIQVAKLVHRVLTDAKPTLKGASASIRDVSRDISKKAKSKDGYYVTISFPDEKTQHYYDVGELKECQFIYEGGTYSLHFENGTSPYICICKDNERRISLAVDEADFVDGLYFELHHDKYN